MRRCFITRSAIDNEGLGSHAAHGARDVHCGVAAAVDHNAAPEHGLFIVSDFFEYAHRVHHARGVSGGHIRAPCKVGSHREKHRVKLSFTALFFKVRNFARADDCDARGADALDFGIKNRPRQTVLGDAVAHHAARQLRPLVNRHIVPHTPQMIGRRKPGRARAHHQNALTRVLSGHRKVPALFNRVVA